MLVLGTRPEAIKMAPVYLALARHADCFDLRLLVTAQHREMLDQVLQCFAIRPDYDLDVMRQGQSLIDLTVAIPPPVEKIFRLERPDLVLVHGDTTTTFLAALAAFYCRIPIGHVEAGLRSGDKYDPYPEEINRRLTDTLADWCFAPTDRARENLRMEGVPLERVFVTGNTVIDALLHIVSRPGTKLPEVARRIPATNRVILVTTHRRESWGAPLRRVYHALRRVVEDCPDVELIFPVHRNPLVWEAAHAILDGIDRIHLCEPLDYADFSQVLRRAYFVVTDSGGVQEEAPALDLPVLVLRETTERPEAVETGAVKLVGTVPERVVQAVMQLLNDDAVYRAMASAHNPYGDGRAAERIVDFLRWKYGFLESPPESFHL
jgi:UDP-N-acetylglucosamine 2-epimerase (non-hydrolysing)